MSGYCPRVTAALDSLVPITSGGAFPYKIESCISLEERHASGKAYVIVVKHLDTGEYDIRPYIPLLRERGTDRESLRNWIISVISQESKELERRGEKVISDSSPVLFYGVLEPSLPDSFTDGKNWEPLINMTLRARSWGQ